MTAQVLLPYRSFSADDVNFSGWRLVDSESGLDRLWERLYARGQAEVDAEITVESPAMERVLGTSWTTGSIDVLAQIRCRLTHHRRIGARVALKPDQITRVRFSIDLSEAVGEIELGCQVVLMTPGGGDAVAPSIPGSILWRSPTELVASASGNTPFPTRVEGFAGSDKRLAWRLEADLSDPSALTTDSVSLVLNENHPAVVSWRDDPESVESRVFLSVIRWDVVRELLTVADSMDLSDDDLVDLPEDSIGSLLRRCALYAGVATWEDARHRLRTDPTGWLEALRRNLRVVES